MGVERKITITLDAEAAKALEALVEAGQHASLEDAVKGALEEWWGDRVAERIGVDRLRQMIADAVDSPTVDGHAVFARLKAKYEAMAEAQGK